MRIAVRVHPKARKEKVAEESGVLHVWVHEAPDKGHANKAVVAILAEYYKIPKGGVRIASGESSRDKLIDILL